MKRFLFFSLMCLMALSLNAQTDVKQVKTAKVDRKAELKAQGYVDLGLPSGTLWKDQNEEEGFLTFNLALSKFGDNLPDREQIEELQNSCEWTWNGSGYKVVGPNGNSIVLPAAGFRNCEKEMRGVGLDSYTSSLCSRYWTSIRGGVDRNGTQIAWILSVCSDKVGVGSAECCEWLSVRLVKRP